MTRMRLFIIGLVLVTVFLFFLALIQQKTTPQVPLSPTPTPSSDFPLPAEDVTPTQAVVPTGESVTINDVTVDNFYQQTTPFDPQGDRTLADVESHYRIVYLSDYQQFLLTITGAPFEQNRQEAEQKLLEVLNISKADACKLDVVIRTPSYANPDQAGQDFSLSFCQ